MIRGEYLPLRREPELRRESVDSRNAVNLVSMLEPIFGAIRDMAWPEGGARPTVYEMIFLQPRNGLRADRVAGQSGRREDDRRFSRDAPEYRDGVAIYVGGRVFALCASI